MSMFLEQLGPVREVELAGTRIRYHETGTGPPIVFVHGVFANAGLWRKVVPRLAAAGFRCIAPDWPLGAHEIPVPHAELNPPAMAELVGAVLAELGLERPMIVGNDTGGAITQLLMARYPERIGSVVLTPSDSYERFFPGMLRLLVPFARIPGSMRLITEALRLRAAQPLAYGALAKHRMPDEVVDSYLLPGRTNAQVRADLRRFIGSIRPRHTLEAARCFPEFRKPVLLAWSAHERFFPLHLARRLAAELPDARLRVIEDTYTFVPEDQPERLTDLILEFADQHASP